MQNKIPDIDLIDLDSADLDDLAPERLLDAMVIEGKGLIADIPLQIEQN